MRELVRELTHQGVSVWLTDIPQWSPRKLPFSHCDPWFETLSKPIVSPTVLHFCMPHQVQPRADRRNVNFTMFEATPAPASWVERNRTHDMLIVPTESSRAAWIAGGMPEERIRVCPLGVDSRLFNSASEPLPLRLPSGVPVARYRARFLNVSELSPRKNVAGLLRAWTRATTAADDAVLIVKLGCSSAEQMDSFRSEIAGIRLESGKALVEAAPVHFLTDLYSESEMPRLFCAATHYCSMSFGEGWDLPAMEAAACGLRLIVPNHSAYTSYLDSSVASLVSSREVPVKWPERSATAMLFQNARWWEPDEDEAAAYIRSAIDGGDMGTPTAQLRIRGTFTWEKAARRLTQLLGEIDPPRTRLSPLSARRRFRASELPLKPAVRLPDDGIPLVSVILATRDRPRLLALALQYYGYQTYANRELIVVDDGELFPADREAIEALNGRLIRMEPGTPLGTKLNAGIEQANGTFCQKMDDDDWYSSTFMESMMATVLESHRSVCRPTVAFLTPFLFFEVARWEIRQSHWRNAPGATLLFSRDAWEMRPFRPLFQDEDVWFHLDQDRCGSTMVPVIALESFLAVRHRGSIRDRGHVWTHQQDGSTLEDDLKQRELHSRQPEDLLPEFAVNVYRELRQELLIAAR